MSEPKQKPGRSKQDYGTPPEFLEAVKQRLGIAEFSIDLAASADNAVTWRHMTAEQDALTAWSWFSGPGWNWLNPPYATIGPWVQRAWEEWNGSTSAATAVLIPAAVGSNWWRDWVHEKARVLFLNPRLTFVGCKDPDPKDCALLLYGLPYGYEVWTWKPSRSTGAGISHGADAKILSSRDITGDGDAQRLHSQSIMSGRRSV
jgi:phage N-6-adenine-methyltransferase